MPQVKLVHCADVHLDASFIGSGLHNQAAKLRAEELKETFTDIIRLVQHERADLFVIAGDLFEHDYVRKSTVQSVVDLISREIPEVPVFIAPGNHDPLTSDSYYATMAWPANVTIFGPRWQSVDLPHLPATVHGWGFDRVHVFDRHLAGLRIPPSDRLQIAVLHGSDELMPSEEGAYLPLNRADCLACGADYIALGHFHGHHVVADRTGPLAQYPGVPESLNFGQTGAHGVLVGTVSKSGNFFRLIPVGRREHLTIDVSVDGARTLEDALTAINAAVPEPDRARHLYRINLVGEVDPDLELDPALVQVRLERFHYVAVSNRTEPARDLVDLAQERSLRGTFVTRMLADLQTSPPEDQEMLRLALREGLRALEGGR